MLNGRPKGASSGSIPAFRPGRLQIRTSSPVRRSVSGVQASETKPAADIKTFLPIKLSLSPGKKKPGKQLQISAKPSNDWESELVVPQEFERFELGPLGFLQELRIDEEKTAEIRLQSAKPTTSIDPLVSAQKPAPQQQHSNTSSKSHFRTSVETALSALTARMFAQLPGKPPSREAERVYHTFVSLINVVEKGTAPEPFQLVHHKAWKALRKLAKTPGKLISAAKLVAKTFKMGSFPADKWPNLMEDLRTSGSVKAGEDDATIALAAFLQCLATQHRTVLLDRELTKKSLDYMEVEEDSPRRKLLQSLLNRSVEEKDKWEPEQRSSRISDVQKSDRDLSPPPASPFQLALQEGEIPAKPNLRKADSPAIRLNLAKLRTKSPDNSQGITKTTPKTTPRKRATPIAAEPVPEVDPQFYTMLLDVKFSVFLRERMRLPNLPETDFLTERIREDFQTWVKRTDLRVSEEILGKYVDNVNRETVEQWQRKLAESSSEQTPTWTQMSLRRDKAKLALDIRPVGRK